VGPVGTVDKPGGSPVGRGLSKACGQPWIQGWVFLSTGRRCPPASWHLRKSVESAQAIRHAKREMVYRAIGASCETENTSLLVFEFQGAVFQLTEKDIAD